MCTRFVYEGENNLVLTARNNDWNEDAKSKMVILPRGAKYTSYLGEKPFSWNSKYGSLIVTYYALNNACDGMNEKGLAVNLLYLAESEYSKNPDANDLSVGQWAQFVLDSFSTVSEAVDFFSSESLNIVPSIMPNGRETSIHLSLSDSLGDSAILEYIKGKLCTHHGKQYKVMTNSPKYEEQLALCNYWQTINKNSMMISLPGTISAADRFVRTSFLLDAIPRGIDNDYISAVPNHSYYWQAISSVYGVAKAVSVPLGVRDPEHPNVSSTLYTVVSDHKNLRYFFNSYTSLSMFWIDLSNIEFDKLSEAFFLDNIQNGLLSGELTLDSFKKCIYPEIV